MVDPVEAQNGLTPPVTSVVIKSPETTSEAPPKADTPQPGRPPGLPPKFKTTEDLIKAYGELEKKLSAPKAATESAKATEPATEAKADDLSIKATEKAVEAAGLKLDDFQNEFAEKGALTPESYAKLEKAGIPKATVDAYIAGQTALLERTVDTMLKDVGGREGYDKIASWAATNVPKEDLDAYNRAVTGPDLAVAKLAIQGLQAKFAAAQEPDFLRRGDAATSRGDVFRSVAQVTEAMRDPRYKKDPAFRDEVAKKIARSDVL